MCEVQRVNDFLPFVVTKVRRLESKTGMGFRARPGSQRSGGCEIASRNKEVQIPRRWHRRWCRAPQNHRPDQLGSRRRTLALGNWQPPGPGW